MLLPRVVDLLRKHGAPPDWGTSVAHDILTNYADDLTAKMLAQDAHGGVHPEDQRFAAQKLSGFFDLYASAPDAFIAVLTETRAMLRRVVGTGVFEVALALSENFGLRDAKLRKQLPDILTQRLGRAVTLKQVEKALAWLARCQELESPLVSEMRGE